MSEELVYNNNDAMLAWRDAVDRLEAAQSLVQKMASLCRGPAFVAEIQGRQYPTVAWWTTVGAALGLFPVEVSCERLNRDGEIAYLAMVEVRDRSGRTVTRASAMCSSAERLWRGRDEYAIRSMAITRATGKAYRLGLAFLAVLAGLEPTPAEEMPVEGEGKVVFISAGVTVSQPTKTGLDYQAFWGRLYEKCGRDEIVRMAGRKALSQNFTDVEEALQFAEALIEDLNTGESEITEKEEGHDG